MKITIRPMVFTAHWVGVVTMPNGNASTTVITSPVARMSVSAPPTASKLVEAKNAVPFCSEAMICISTMRASRDSVRRIHTSR